MTKAKRYVIPFHGNACGPSISGSRAAVAQMGGQARCAFYMSNAEQTELRHVTGMSADYARDIDGFPIAPDSFACGLAVHTRQPVITPDVDGEPRWKEWLWLARQHGYRACWSFPVETSSGKVIGTFAMYHPEPREATARDHELATRLGHSAAIIISRHQEAEERAHSAEALRLADRAGAAGRAIRGFSSRCSAARYRIARNERL
ncbi:GAF sensor-containing diguanylate cyclase/phosphodiesterase [Caballeronia calidae]|uniref:GAF sensor-containing diguanylate cyclase/phosphodiesterase n=1 Tax=Caballeronia calidae TaxID=1777139 RepID=A0A158CXA8_9BURK|nr:GAF domain-containing protein [Caballeronia calidae]SAK86992.1 GAF sensor-containing diguanylate cyclase/phosphodiesterase [Caballeronia calidae]